ncbi:hypothetical protein P781_14400 [Vibrio mimicus CAIM 1883]|nr:hypothetical protein P780_14385 [Vibrio mimicus CAIM 1882]ERM54264.1 hypothetical protein P781_14400 [Vibrio mimicus CAIM 1883]
MIKIERMNFMNLMFLTDLISGGLQKRFALTSNA